MTVTVGTGLTTTAATGTTAGTTSTATTATTLLLRLCEESEWYRKGRPGSLTAGTTLAVAAGADAAIPKSCRPLVHAQSTFSISIVPPLESSPPRRTVVIGVVALLGAALIALALNGRGSLDVGTVALAVPGSGLVDGLCWWLGGPVGVELRVVACGVVSEFS